MYKNVVLYIPDVVFINGEETSSFDVVVCPAPNYNAAKNKGVTSEENFEFLLSRIEIIKGITEENKVDTLILVTFGYGIRFKNGAGYTR